jgi:hypothetical protein
MVKKIRILDEPMDEEIEQADMTKLYELAKTMDWKLWEMLQIMQRFERKINVLDDQSIAPDTEPKTTEPKTTRRVK